LPERMWIQEAKRFVQLTYSNKSPIGSLRNRPTAWETHRL